VCITSATAGGAFGPATRAEPANAQSYACRSHCAADAGSRWTSPQGRRGFKSCPARSPHRHPVGIVDLEYRLHRLQSQMVNSLRDPSIPRRLVSRTRKEPLRRFKGQLEVEHFQDLGADMFDQCPMWHDDTWRRWIRREWNSTRFAIRALPAASHQGRRHLRDHVTNKARKRGARSLARSPLPVVPPSVGRQRRRRLSVSTFFLPFPVSTASESSVAFMRARFHVRYGLSGNYQRLGDIPDKRNTMDRTGPSSEGVLPMARPVPATSAR
jgi:hypothetical protein